MVKVASETSIAESPAVAEESGAPGKAPRDSAAAAQRPLRRTHHKLSLIGRLALRLAPLYGPLYDWQMRRGGGVRLVRHRLQLPRFPAGVPSLRLVYLSDLHYGPTSGTVALRQAWDLAHEAHPDVLLLGGDYLYGDERGLPALVRELQRWQAAPPPGGMYACLGNHDRLANLEALTMCLQACDVQVLVNRAVELPSPWSGVWVAGCDDTRYGQPQPERALNSVPRQGCTLMLSHEPDICEVSSLARCDLTLCGHTHGGQICLPNGRSLYLPSRWSHQFTAGLYRHAGHWLFVSRGVGTVGLPVRMWAPPEIAVFELVPRGSHR